VGAIFLRVAPILLGNVMSYRKTFVESGNVSAVEYDDFIETLTVYFKNGAVYDYIGVPPDIADEFLISPSKNWYLKNRIITQYEHMKKGLVKEK